MGDHKHAVLGCKTAYSNLYVLLLGADAFPWWIEGSYSVIQVGTKRPNFLSGKSDKWNNETLFRGKTII